MTRKMQIAVLLALVLGAAAGWFAADARCGGSVDAQAVKTASASTSAKPQRKTQIRSSADAEVQEKVLRGRETAGDCPHILRQFLTHLPQPLGPVYIAALSSGEQYITKQSPYRRVDDGADCADIERKDIRTRGPEHQLVKVKVAALCCFV